MSGGLQATLGWDCGYLDSAAPHGRGAVSTTVSLQICLPETFLKPERLLLRRTAVSDVTLYWLFVLGLTSGARLEEVGQGRIRDVKTDAGVTCIDVDDLQITSAAHLPDKHLKTAGSRRVIPVHDLALALDFTDYVRALQKAGAELLFPDLLPNQFGKVTHEASRRANRYINKTVADDPRLVFHSVRHRFKDEGREAEVQERVLDQLCGHEPATVGGRYGDGAGLASLKRSLDRLRFVTAGWEAMIEAAAEIDWGMAAAELTKRVAARPITRGKTS